MKKSVLFILALSLVYVSAWAAEAPAHEFTGAKKCSLCHKKPEQGEQYGIWLNSAHSKAFEVLATPEAKAAALKLGVADPQQSGQCLECHSTAYYFTKEKVSETIAVEEGVSCESCHGPGKDYAKKSVMEDESAAKEAGLIIPDEATCKKCHNENNPNPKPFDFKERWEKIKHPVKK